MLAEIIKGFHASSKASAAIVVPDILRTFQPKSVVDIGCGTGAWKDEFIALGVPAVGVDGPWMIADVMHDLMQPLALGCKYDLALCLHVAETLPQSVAETLVASCVDASDRVLWASAPPGQGGYNHVNEQPLVYWERLFLRHGYHLANRYGLKFSSNGNVAWWYSGNMVTFESGRLQISSGKYLQGIRNIVPVILTCCQDNGYFEAFVKSYKGKTGTLPDPIVIVDLTGGNVLTPRYISLLNRLTPRAVHIHPRLESSETDPFSNDNIAYGSIEDAAFLALRMGAAETEPFVMFMEDDIAFSSKFETVLEGEVFDTSAGFYSLYQPGTGYGEGEIDATGFFGTQCVLFPKEAAKLLADNSQEVIRNFRPGYDIRWSRFLASRGLKVYAMNRSYVQHIGTHSRMGHYVHTSEIFEA